MKDTMHIQHAKSLGECWTCWGRGGCGERSPASVVGDAGKGGETLPLLWLASPHLAACAFGKLWLVSVQRGAVMAPKEPRAQWRPFPTPCSSCKVERGSYNTVLLPSIYSLHGG